MELSGSSASWSAARKLREDGIPEDQVQREIAAWRESGWQPRSAFTTAMIAAHSARQSGAPEAVVEGMVRPWLDRYGAGAIGEAFVRIRSASDKLTNRAAEREAKRK